MTRDCLPPRQVSTASATRPQDPEVAGHAIGEGRGHSLRAETGGPPQIGMEIVRDEPVDHVLEEGFGRGPRVRGTGFQEVQAIRDQRPVVAAIGRHGPGPAGQQLPGEPRHIRRQDGPAGQQGLEPGEGHPGRGLGTAFVPRPADVLRQGGSQVHRGPAGVSVTTTPAAASSSLSASARSQSLASRASCLSRTSRASSRGSSFEPARFSEGHGCGGRRPRARRPRRGPRPLAPAVREPGARGSGPHAAHPGRDRLHRSLPGSIGARTGAGSDDLQPRQPSRHVRGRRGTRRRPERGLRVAAGPDVGRRRSTTPRLVPTG